MSMDADSLPVPFQEHETSRMGRLAALAARPSVLALAGILAVGLAFRLMYPFGLVKVDPFTYADAATSIARWEPVFDSQLTGDVYYTQYIRLPLIVPAAVLYRLFGPTDAASIAFPIVLSLGASLVAYWFMRRAAGELAGLCAAGLWALFPLAIINSTQFLPDVVQASWGGIAAVCIIGALCFERTSRPQRAWLYFVGGAGLALAFYSRGTAIALLPPLAVIGAIHWRKVWPEAAWLVAGGAAVLLAFQALIVALGAEPLEDFRVLYRLGSGSRVDIDYDYLHQLVRTGLFAPFTWLGALGLALIALRGGWRTVHRTPMFALLLVVLGQYVYFEFFMSLPGTPTWWKEPRYILPLAFPIVLFAGAGLGLLLERARAIHWSAAAGIAAVATAAFVALAVHEAGGEWDFYREQPGNRWDAEQRQVADFLDSQPRAPVYVANDDYARPLSFRMGSAGTFYERFEEGTSRLRNRFDGDGLSAVTPGSYVVALGGERWWGTPTGPGSTWTLLWEAPSGTAVYRVDPPGEDAVGVHEDLRPPLTVAGAELVQAGLTSGVLPANHHLGIELVLAEPSPIDLSLALAVRCGDASGPAALLPVPRGNRIARQDIRVEPPNGITGPADCAIVLADTGTELIPLHVPALVSLEAEDLAGEAWSVFANPRFSRGAALLATGSDVPLTLPVDSLAAGEYWLALRFYDYGTGEGTVEAALNGVSATGQWGATGEPGLVETILHFEDVPTGDKLELRLSAAGQDAILLDAVALTSVEPSRVGSPAHAGR